MKMGTAEKMNKRGVKYLAVLFIVLFLLVGIGYYIWATGDAPSDNNGINYSPSSKEDKKYNDEHKAELGSTNTNPIPNTSGASKKQVTPVITAYGQPDGAGSEFRLNGFVPSIIESDGSCVLTLTKDGIIATVSKGALRNAQDTSCGQLVVSFDAIGPGRWQAVLSYESSSSKGASVATEVDIR